MQTNPAVEQNERTLNGPRISGVSTAGEGKVYGGIICQRARSQAGLEKKLGFYKKFLGFGVLGF